RRATEPAPHTPARPASPSSGRRSRTSAARPPCRPIPPCRAPRKPARRPNGHARGSRRRARSSRGTRSNGSAAEKTSDPGRRRGGRPWWASPRQRRGPRYTRTSLLRSFQGAVEVVDQVLRVLEADREAYGPGGDAGALQVLVAHA